MSKAFIGIDHGKGKVVLFNLGKPRVMRPIQIHHKEDGSMKDEPTFAMVMTDNVNHVVGEISLEMFNEGLKDIGYEVVKTKKS